jgi:hypothetical protein
VITQDIFHEIKIIFHPLGSLVGVIESDFEIKFE